MSVKEAVQREGVDDESVFARIEEVRALACGDDSSSLMPLHLVFLPIFAPSLSPALSQPHTQFQSLIFLFEFLSTPWSTTPYFYCARGVSCIE